MKRKFVGRVEYESEDHGSALISRIDDEHEENLFVQIQSWDESGKHSAARKLEHKLVRVTVETLPEQPITVKHDGTEPGDLMEDCCFCHNPTRYWVDVAEISPNDAVACCRECAQTHWVAELPTKEEWCLAVRSRRKESVRGRS